MATVTVDKARVDSKVKSALEYLETTFTEPSYESGGSPNDGDEITEEAFTNALDVLIEPFTAMLERCGNAD